MDYPNPLTGISKEGALAGGGIRPEWARLPETAGETEEETEGAAGLSPALCDQLGLIKNSQNLMMLSIVGLAIQYRSLDVQRCLLLDSAANPGQPGQSAPASPENELCDPKTMQLAASLLILASLLGFQQQANCLAAQSAAAGVCDFLEPKLNATAIAIALIRYFKLLQSGQARPGESEAAAELEETEELTEPIL